MEQNLFKNQRTNSSSGKPLANQERIRRNASVRLRQTVFDVALPFVDGEKKVRCVRPAHSTDNLVVLCTEENIKILFDFVLAQGIDVDDLVAKRPYRSSGEVGLWKCGSKFVSRVPDDSKERGFRWKIRQSTPDHDCSDATIDSDHAEDCDGQASEANGNQDGHAGTAGHVSEGASGGA